MIKEIRGGGKEKFKNQNAKIKDWRLNNFEILHFVQNDKVVLCRPFGKLRVNYRAS